MHSECPGFGGGTETAPYPSGGDGVNNVDLEAARSCGIAVTNVRHYCSEAVAQYTMGMILALAGQIPAYDQAVKSGCWSNSPFFVLSAFPVQELRGRTLGILGYGAIGRQVARLALAFGMRVRIAALPGRAYSIRKKKRRRPLGRLLQEVDYLTLHLPLTEKTRGLIGAPALARMKPGAFLINMARGGIVDEGALACALRKGRLAGAASDVLSQEPPAKNHILFKAPRMILTPHVSWATPESRRRAVDEIALNIRAFLKGRRRNRIV